MLAHKKWSRCRSLQAGLTLCLAKWAALALFGVEANAQVAVAAKAEVFTEARVYVPRRPEGKFQISEVEVTLTLDSSNPIALLITGPRKGALQTRDMVLTDSTIDCFDEGQAPKGMVCFAEMQTPDAPVNDNVLIIKPAHASLESNKIRLLLQFPRVDAVKCIDGIYLGEQWRIEVVGGAKRIVSSSVLSFDRSTETPPACTTGRRPLLAGEGASTSTGPFPEPPTNVRFEKNQ